MDLTSFYRKYRPDGRGQAAFEPSMMTSLLLYAYSVGARSSRQIERLCERDIAFKVIAANQVPAHSTIARFRQENGRDLAGCCASLVTGNW
ncbi:MAG TPA: transposase [Nitrospiria bacterium]|nr:transposase [Nitrospiria bacterium]